MCSTKNILDQWYNPLITVSQFWVVFRPPFRSPKVDSQTAVEVFSCSFKLLFIYFFLLVLGQFFPKKNVTRNTVLDTRTSVLYCVCVCVFVMLLLPPWILKPGGLESSGQRLISLNSWNKRIAFLDATALSCNAKLSHLLTQLLTLFRQQVTDREDSKGKADDRQ